MVWPSGKKFSKSHKAKLSKAGRGRAKTVAHRRKIGISNKGKLAGRPSPRRGTGHGRKQEQARKVVEKRIGTQLRSYQLVHHIDEDKSNNRFQNLIVVTRADHARIHNIVRALRRLDPSVRARLFAEVKVA